MCVAATASKWRTSEVRSAKQRVIPDSRPLSRLFQRFEDRRSYFPNV